MAASSLGTGAAMAMNLLRLISRSQLPRPTSVVYGEGVADEEEDGPAMARAGAGPGEALALAQAKLRRTVAASGWESRRGMERRRGDTRSRRRTAAMSRGAWLGGNRGPCVGARVPCTGRSCSLGLVGSYSVTGGVSVGYCFAEQTEVRDELCRARLPM